MKTKIVQRNRFRKDQKMKIKNSINSNDAFMQISQMDLQKNLLL